MRQRVQQEPQPRLGRIEESWFPLTEMGEFEVTVLNQITELFRVLDLRRQPNPSRATLEDAKRSWCHHWFV